MNQHPAIQLLYTRRTKIASISDDWESNLAFEKLCAEVRIARNQLFGELARQLGNGPNHLNSNTINSLYYLEIQSSFLWAVDPENRTAQIRLENAIAGKSPTGGPSPSSIFRSYLELTT